MERQVLFDSEVNGYQDNLIVMAAHHDYKTQAPITSLWLYLDQYKTGVAKVTELRFHTWQLRVLLEKLQEMIGDDDK